MIKVSKKVCNVYFHIVSWEPERKGAITIQRYSVENQKGTIAIDINCTAIAPFWFSSREHLWILIAPFWLSTDDIYRDLFMIYQLLPNNGFFNKTILTQAGRNEWK